MKLHYFMSIVAYKCVMKREIGTALQPEDCSSLIVSHGPRNKDRSVYILYRNNMICLYDCKEFGHLSRDCPQRRDIVNRTSSFPREGSNLGKLEEYRILIKAEAPLYHLGMD